MKLLTTLMLAATLALSPMAPALAVPDEAIAKQEYQHKSPALAATLTGVAPVALLGTGVWLAFYLPFPGFLMMASSPIGLGAGHFYAGDLARGGAFSIGVPAAALTLGLIGESLPYEGIRPSPAGVGLFLAGLIGFGVWAGVDAHQTALRTNADSKASSEAP